MKLTLTKQLLLLVSLTLVGTAHADFGVGVRAGTLGLGVEGRWSALPWLDIRVGANQFDYKTEGSQAGIGYDATLAMDNFYVTGNLRFPLSPFRLTAGAYSNGNELQLSSRDTGGANFSIGGTPFSSADIGTLQSVSSFEKTSPYFGVGYDFELFSKVGLNLDFGALWQGEPSVSLIATGFDTAPADVQAQLTTALEAERAELEAEIKDYKLWPVVSLSFVYNF